MQGSPTSALQWGRHPIRALAQELHRINDVLSWNLRIVKSSEKLQHMDHLMELLDTWRHVEGCQQIAMVQDDTDSN